MKQIKNLLLLSSFAFLLGIFIVSCEKPLQPDTQSTEDDAKGSLVVSDAFAFSNNAANSDAGKTIIDECFTVEFTGIYPERVMTLTFDSCVSNDFVRDGQIVVTLNGIWGVGKEMTITFNNYSVNGIFVEGTVTATYNLASETPEFTLVSQNMKLTFPDKRTTTWNSEKTFTMTAGMDTPLIRIDDIFIINGNKSGVNRNGEAYSSEYLDVESDKSCDWPKKGTVKITKEGESETTIDFDQDGNAACDNIVTVTREGVSITVNL